MSERSKGKMRPSLVRSSDLRTGGTGPERPVNHAPDGRWKPGNTAASGRGAKRTQKKLLGPAGGCDAEKIVRRDAWHIFTATMRVMPSDAPPVRSLVSLHSRHLSVGAFYTARASEVGLDTPEGMKLQEAADRQSQRAERVLVTAMDVARACSQQEARTRGPVDPLAKWMQPPPEKEST